MNFQQLFSALLFLLFMRKSNSDTQDKVKRASGIRTFTYFILSFIFGIFFYKTYQVKTISNGISLDPIIASYDTAGICGDTIHKFNIFLKLDDGGIYQSFKRHDEGSIAKNGGFFAEIWSPIYEPYKFKINTNLSKEIIKLIDSKLKLNDFHTCYNAIIATIQPPSLFPFSQTEFIDTTFTENYLKMDFFTIPLPLVKEDLYEYLKEIPDERYLNYGSFMSFTEGALNSFDIPEDNNYLITKMNANSEKVNTFNIFTAGDISQFSYVLSLNCSLPIDRLLVDFDQPIEILDNDSCIKVNPTSFVVDGARLDSIRTNKENLMFHIKLPTNTNLQLIRSFVLTSIFTALLALFFNNLYYVVRRWSQEYYKKHRLPIKILRKISRKRVLRYRKFLYLLSITIIAIIGASFILVALEMPIILNIEQIWKPITLTVLLLCLIVFIVYKVYRYAIKPVGRDKKKKNK